jgi:hypothetical protein
MRKVSLEVRWALALTVYGLCLVGVYVHRHGDLSVGLALATSGSLGARAARGLGTLAAAGARRAPRRLA